MIQQIPTHSKRSLTRRHVASAGLLSLAMAAWWTPAASRPAPRGPLWRVRKGRQVVYVLGETLPRLVDWQAPEIQALLMRCGHLWTETNQTYRRPVDELVKAFGMSNSASPLRVLTSDQAARLETAAARAHVSLDELVGARPWLVGATIEDAGYRAAGLTGKSANTILRAHAIAAGIPVSSEFAVKDDVFAWFGGMSPEEDAQFLCYVVDGVLLGASASERMSIDWRSGRPGPAARFVEHERHHYPALYRKLTVDRNRAWVPRFDLMSRAATPTLVVVGLYHLVGPDSLLMQLERAGYAVSSGL